MTGDMQSCTQGNVSHQLNDLTGDMKLACGSGNKDVTWEMQTCSHGNVSHELTEGPCNQALTFLIDASILLESFFSLADLVNKKCIIV